MGPIKMIMKRMQLPDNWATISGVASINGEMSPSGVWRSTL
eukprot:CAMPEP_0171261094 /NCGR_PEP_ID=MMETSP0790-20130122/55802_1 /TAXON_ID=2925 /ORGANISM="Alexandrium catenella, Strain OF101" /LENGTH=40 /DNA_ID= /DNA_START= /DNA_END= /DNA_ORIENTATION=